MSEKKLCINCFHYEATFFFKHYKEIHCMNEKLDTEQENVVTGGFIKVADLCLDVRLDEKLCGWEGKWFEPRSSHITTEVETNSISRPIATTKARSRSKISLEDLM